MSIRKIDDDIRNRYPYPLSGTFHRAYYDTRDITLIHDYLFDLFEVTLKFLTSCVLAQYIQDGSGDPTINSSLLNLQRPSLGHWQGWLRDILKFYAKQKQTLLIPEIASVYERKTSAEMYSAFMSLRAMMVEQMDFRGDGKNYQAITTQQFFDLLGQYRNRVAHGAKLNVYDRKQVVGWLLPAMRELFVSLDFTARYRLVFINEVKMAANRRTMSYEHYITDLTGYGPSIVNEPFVLTAAAGRPEELYICARDEDFAPMLSLHPFLIYRFCKECSSEQAFVLNQSREDTLSYLSYQCSHQFSLTEYLDDIETILGALRKNGSTGTAAVQQTIATMLTPAADQLPAEELERRRTLEADRQAELRRREAEDRSNNATERQLEVQQDALDSRLVAAQSLLDEERRKLVEDRQRVAAELERIRKDAEEREAQRLAEDQRKQQEEARRRAAIGAQQSIICANCGRLNPPDKKFCANCGARLAGAATLGQQPQQQPQPVYNQPNWQQPQYNNQRQTWPQQNNQPVYQQPQPQPQPVWNQPQPQQQPVVQPPAAVEGSKTCPRCGRQNGASRKFCTSCGYAMANVPLDAPPGSATQQMPPNDSAVQNVGAMMGANTVPLPAPVTGEKICPRCGRSNPATRKFCSSCGLNLTEVAPTPTATPPASRSVEPTPAPAAAPEPAANRAETVAPTGDSTAQAPISPVESALETAPPAGSDGPAPLNMKQAPGAISEVLQQRTTPDKPHAATEKRGEE